jgi:hypothetical protein
MKKLSLYLLLSSITLVISGCSSRNDVVSVSEAHYYNENFGLVQNNLADRLIQQELVAMSLPTKIDIHIDMNPEWTMELTKDVDAFYAHDYVQPDEVISYKYKFYKKFYDHAEWRKAEF